MREPSFNPQADGQKLCRACGLCCRGVWFSRGLLDDDEIGTARRMGLKVEMGVAEASFTQPCPLYKDSCCSTYNSWRPKACSSYSCALLDKFIARGTSLDTALTLVREARVMADRLVKETGHVIGGLKSMEFVIKLQLSPGEELEGQGTLSPNSRMDAVALTVFYQRYFKKNSPSGEEGSPEPGDLPH